MPPYPPSGSRLRRSRAPPGARVPPTYITLATALKWGGRTQNEESGVKYFSINQFTKCFSPSMAVNSYLNDNEEGKQFYFSLGSFFNSTKFKFRLKVAISFLDMCYTSVFPESQALS